MRRFVKDQRARRLHQRLESFAPLRAGGRQEADKVEVVGGQPGSAERGRKSRRPRHRHHRNTVANRQRHQVLPGVGHPRQPGITHQRHLRSLLHLQHQLGRAHHLVVLMVALFPLVDAVMVEELGGPARVFAGDQVNFFQHPQRPQGDVFQIADGRRY